MGNPIPSGPSFGDKVQNFWEGKKSGQSDEVTVKNETAIFSTVSIFAEPIFSKEQMDKAGVFGRGLSLLNVVWGGAINFTPLLLVHASIATCCNAVKANTVTNNLSKKIELEAKLLQNEKSIKNWKKAIEGTEGKIKEYEEMKNPETEKGRAKFEAQKEKYSWDDETVRNNINKNSDAKIKSEMFNKKTYQNNLTRLTENNKEIKKQLREIYTNLGFTNANAQENVQGKVISNTIIADELEVKIRKLTTEIVNLNSDRPEGYLTQVGEKRSELNTLQSKQNLLHKENAELGRYGVDRLQKLQQITSSLEEEIAEGNLFAGNKGRVTTDQKNQLEEKIYVDKGKLQKLTYENTQAIKNSEAPQSLESLKEELTLHLQILEAHVAKHGALASREQTGVISKIRNALLSEDVKTCAAVRDDALKNSGMNFYALLNQLTYRENLTGPKQLKILKEILNTPQSIEKIQDRDELIGRIDAALLKPDNLSEGLRRDILVKIDRFAWDRI